jgi:hypothetical protein
MRRTRVALSTAAALIAGPLAFASNRAEAMVGAPQLSQAAQSINPIEKTACWRLGLVSVRILLWRLPLRRLRRVWLSLLWVWLASLPGLGRMGSWLGGWGVHYYHR